MGTIALLIIRIFFFLMSISFTLSSLLVFKTNDLISKFLYRISAMWLGTTWFLGLVTIPIVLLGLSSFLSQILFLVAILVSIGSVVNGSIIRVSNIEIKISNIPDIWKGKRAVLLSDSHLGNLRGREFMQQVVDAVLTTKPDIVFIVGDLYDGQSINYNDVISPLRKLTSTNTIPLGVYFVTGNHEEFEDPTKYLLAIQSAGIKILDDQTENIQGVTIAGVDHKKTEDRGNYERILESMLIGVDKKSPIILLKHVPSNIDVAEKNNINLSLHGHTHNGQIWPLGYIARKMFKGYEYGLKKFKGMDVYTSSGVGTWGPPQRFFTRSEIVKIVFI